MDPQFERELKARADFATFDETRFALGRGFFVNLNGSYTDNVYCSLWFSLESTPD